jgi:hypothetical protein
VLLEQHRVPLAAHHTFDFHRFSRAAEEELQELVLREPAAAVAALEDIPAMVALAAQ